ncbi:cellulose binding domain-containing protein, partial [Actinomadura sp. 6K520]|uniref:cellulose binding domain-containing protein n=1 Tax=Actinomadura sp. 6K520 TaxID=2530364 RepID=UPI0010CF8416
MRSLTPRTAALAALAGALLTAGSLVTGTGRALGTADAAVACEVDYTTDDWGTGFTAALTITNLGSSVDAWTLTYTYAGNQRLASGWNGRWSQSGGTVTVSNESWNGSLATGAAVQVGAQFAYTGTNTAPSGFALNGMECGGDPTDPPTDPPTT